MRIVCFRRWCYRRLRYGTTESTDYSHDSLQQARASQEITSNSIAGEGRQDHCLMECELPNNRWTDQLYGESICLISYTMKYNFIRLFWNDCMFACLQRMISLIDGAMERNYLMKHIELLIECLLLFCEVARIYVKLSLRNWNCVVFPRSVRRTWTNNFSHKKTDNIIVKYLLIVRIASSLHMLIDLLTMFFYLVHIFISICFSSSRIIN
jgi:hypothetical protein